LTGIVACQFKKPYNLSKYANFIPSSSTFDPIEDFETGFNTIIANFLKIIPSLT